MAKVILVVKNGGRTQIQAYVTFISKSVLFPLHRLLAICWNPSTGAAQAQDPYLLKSRFPLEVILISQSLTSQSLCQNGGNMNFNSLLQALLNFCYLSDPFLPENLVSRPKAVMKWSLPHKHTVTISLHIILSLASYLRVLVHVFIQIFMENQLSYMPDPQPRA